ncbi:class I SAM-dependent methyltransferase [Streptomyces sp. NPDC005329]|uniref:class I SAM-dependent DNA methyltransferase n=1 Tax=Streptomyces sp. NPDC005329 TaxID=3157034 RepID=UPI0033B1BD1D
MPAQHDYAMETEVWDAYAESAFDPDAEPVFHWTQYKGHGPGHEVLGNPRRTLEIGCGTGRSVAYLARRGVEAHGLDLSPIMVKKVSERWADTGAVFHQGEVLSFLTTTSEKYDAIYSIFGCAWFSDPEELFPLVWDRLNPGGVFAFSHPPAIPGAYGPQGMYKGGFAGKPLYTYRYSHSPRKWRNLLLEARFHRAGSKIIDAPTEGHIGTLFASAVRPE